MTRTEIVKEIKRKKSFLCVGLDTDQTKLPHHLRNHPDGMLEFNKAIIDATKDFAVAYKPNLAFYERHGSKGWELLKETIAYIPDECFVIADAKRGDIGNTASYYAEAIFNDLGADAITVAPYMGEDSIRPFLEHKDKWTIVLALTSNPGANDFQYLGQPPLYQQVVSKCVQWSSPDQLMFVTGATRGADLAHIRALAPDHFFLVPGVGAQGGDLDEVCRAACNNEIGLLVNSSRGIIYASSEEDFALAARNAAALVAEQMNPYIQL
ncbi:MAG: orotidine-5-phosphate decarboxylase [Bacteroidota bacterium]|jgi:orotidine-5'-phosphate decarboxylase